MRAKLFKLISVSLFMVWFNPSFASTGAIPLAKISFTQDADSLQRGAMVYYNVCRVCHSMKYIRYKSLFEIGLSKEQVDEMRGDISINEVMSKTVNDDALKEFYGRIPPDLSLMAKARKGGARHIYTLLTSFNEKDGVYDNAFFPGVRMPDIMNISTAEGDAEKEEKIRDIKDVSEFLLWASDPRAAERKKTGYFVVAYFIVLSLLLFVIMKRVWSRLDH